MARVGRGMRKGCLVVDEEDEEEEEEEEDGVRTGEARVGEEEEAEVAETREEEDEDDEDEDKEEMAGIGRFRVIFRGGVCAGEDDEEDDGDEEEEDEDKDEGGLRVREMTRRGCPSLLVDAPLSLSLSPLLFSFSLLVSFSLCDFSDLSVCVIFTSSSTSASTIIGFRTARTVCFGGDEDDEAEEEEDEEDEEEDTVDEDEDDDEEGGAAVGSGLVERERRGETDL